MRSIDCVICILGAVVGAGFASGREIASFFTAYGTWAPWLALLATILICLICGMVMLRARQENLVALEQGQGIAGALLTALLLITGGTMLAATGEAAALTLPIVYAREIGMALTLLLAFVLAGGSIKKLALPSYALLPVLLLILLLVQNQKTAPVEAPTVQNGLLGLLKCLAYVGMNCMLALSVLIDSGKNMEKGRIARTSVSLMGLLFIIMGLSVRALLYADQSVQSGALPFVLLLRREGAAGYYLAAAVLYLASLSTLAAVLRLLLTRAAGEGRLRSRAMILIALLLVSMIGLEDLVEKAYPILGGGCFVLLAIALLNKKKSQLS